MDNVGTVDPIAQEEMNLKDIIKRVKELEQLGEAKDLLISRLKASITKCHDTCFHSIPLSPNVRSCENK